MDFYLSTLNRVYHFEPHLHTMVQANCVIMANTSTRLWRPWNDEARFHLKCKEMAARGGGATSPTANTNATANGGKWKRERRPKTTPPAYPLKTSPLQHPEPIDMSTRKMRGSPPSYSQTIQAGYINRPAISNSGIQNSKNNNIRDTVADGVDADLDMDGSMPVIDEHFRRSLGKDYQSVFASSSSSSASNRQRQRITSNGQTTDDSSSDSPDNSGSALSVDEHFAKALGDTWHKLQQKEKVSSPSTTSHHLSSSSSSSSTMTITTTTNAPLVINVPSSAEHALLRLKRIEP